MGYRKIPTIYTLTFTGELEGLIVRMKSSSLGKMRQLVRSMGSDDDTDSETFAVVDDVVAMLAEHLVSWNYEDEEGRPIPANEEGLNQLELAFVLELSHRYMDEISGPSAELGKDSTSGAQFPGRPLTMEAL